MTEPTMAERDAQRAEGWYWILVKFGPSARGPEWEVALWEPKRRCFGPGWFEAGDESDLVANQVLEVNETRLEPPQ